jgi:hypothetical protein
MVGISVNDSEGRRWNVFQIMFLRGVCGPKSEEVADGR